MKIYTKTGDRGETSLFGGGRVRKDAARIAAYGSVDELNAAVGYAASLQTDGTLTETLKGIQRDLFILGADLATPLQVKSSSVVRIDRTQIDRLERSIDAVETELEPLRAFILPGGSPAASALHIARTVCRRAEREVVALAQSEEINSLAIVHLNRISDFLFVLARLANKRAGVPDILWIPHKDA